MTTSGGTGQTRLTEKEKRLFLVLAVFGLAVFIVWQLAERTERRVQQELYGSGVARAQLYAQSLKDALEKYRHLPYVLARDARIRGLLAGNLSPIKVNPHLEDFAAVTGSILFILDSEGTTVASSNWRSPRSLVGHNYSFRPYFEAAAGDKRAGGYYAVGLQTREPGFFLSYPVLAVGELIGVVVVKVDLQPIRHSWTEGGETVMVSDAHGVIILSSNPELEYSTLEPLPEKTKMRLKEGQYLDALLSPLSIARSNLEFGNILSIGDDQYLEIPFQLPEYGWRLHYLSDVRQLRNSVNLTILGGISFFLILFLLLLYTRERRLKLISRQEARDAAEIRELNRRLRAEVNEHERTEGHLRKTQKELLQAGKLAALGRMSAAVAHELNQPVTAIRMFLASCVKLIKRGEIDKVEKNLQLISGLTDRMAGITGQLKSFSRKDSGRRELVDLHSVVERVLEFMQPVVEKEEVTVVWDGGGSAVANVRGGRGRLEQILTNLLRNGMDAVAGLENRRIEVGLETSPDCTCLWVEDSGPGVAQEDLEFIFEPFFTTKDSGEGLGLGLSISYGIVQDLGGSIRVESKSGGGARFIVEFPMVTDDE